MSDSESECEVDDMDIEVPEFVQTEEEDNQIKAARLSALKKLQEEVLENGGGEILSSERQLAYLMSQSEVFAHFLTDGDVSVDAPSEKRKSKSKKNNGGLGGGVGRTRMSEEAEDRRLMKLAQSKGVDQSRVFEQPHTIVGR